MKVERQIQFWLGAALVIAALLWLLSGVILPFAAGLTLAYLLNPVASRLERLGVSRLVASLLIVGIAAVVIFSAVVALLPLLIKQAAQFIERLPFYASQLADLLGRYGDQISGRLQPALEFFGLTARAGEGDAGLPKTGDLVSQGARWLGTLVASLWQGGQAILSLVSLLVITPIVTFYLLVDWRRLVSTLDDLVPVRQREVVRGLAREIDVVMAGFIRGQSFVCLFLGLWYGLGFTMVGLNFGMLIGITAGVLSFIPYVGSITGLILSVGVALVQGPGWGLLGLVLAIQFTGQFIEGNILTPRFVGEAVGLHPVWVMFALLAFGSLFGFTGLILAVPIAAVIGVLTRFGVGQYRVSPLYTGAGLRAPKDPDIIP
jgi:predicted PurR-regulated permease PerM